METRNILITDPIHPQAIKDLTEAGFTVTELPEEHRGRLAEFVTQYHAIICRTSTIINKEVLDNAEKLKCIAIASTGYDRIDLAESTKHDVAVLGLPSHNKSIDPEHNGNFVSTAEHAILLILSALGNIYSATHSLKDRRWEKKHLIGNELAGKTVGIFGFGRIAGLVAKRLAPFQTKLIAYDPYANAEKAALLNVDLVSFETLCKESDVITIHAPLTEETNGKFDANAFNLMKEGVYLVNTARFDIINEQDLIAALDSKKVCRVALDVFHDEPTGLNYDLITLPNVIATPHIGGSTYEAWERISVNAAKNIMRFFDGEMPNKIN